MGVSSFSDLLEFHRGEAHDAADPIRVRLREAVVAHGAPLARVLDLDECSRMFDGCLIFSRMFDDCPIFSRMFDDCLILTLVLL